MSFLARLGYLSSISNADLDSDARESQNKHACSNDLNNMQICVNLKHISFGEDCNPKFRVKVASNIEERVFQRIT